MKLKLQSHIIGIQRGPEFTTVTLAFSGKVLSTKMVNDAKVATMTAELKLKTAVTSDLRLGTIFEADMHDEASDERLD